MFFNLNELIDHLTRPFGERYRKWQRQQRAAAWWFSFVVGASLCWLLARNVVEHMPKDTLSLMSAIAGNTVFVLLGTFLAHLLGAQLFAWVKREPPRYDD